MRTMMIPIVNLASRLAGKLTFSANSASPKRVRHFLFSVFFAIPAAPAVDKTGAARYIRNIARTGTRMALPFTQQQSGI